MLEIEERWMAWIDREVRDVCEKKGWGSQIRRKWSVREKPVPESSLEDYEWKLMPGSSGKLPERPAAKIDEGVYYVLQFDRRGGKFVLEHDTVWGGADIGPHWDLKSRTDIDLLGWFRRLRMAHDLRAATQQPVEDAALERRLAEPGPDGWLSDHLVALTTRFQPNRYSIS